MTLSLVAAVADRGISCCLTCTEPYLAVLTGIILLWSKVCALVGAIAKGLALALTTAAPEVGFSGFNFDTNGRVARSYWIRHIESPKVLLKGFHHVFSGADINVASGLDEQGAYHAIIDNHRKALAADTQAKSRGVHLKVESFGEVCYAIGEHQ